MCLYKICASEKKGLWIYNYLIYMYAHLSTHILFNIPSPPQTAYGIRCYIRYSLCSCYLFGVFSFKFKTQEKFSKLIQNLNYNKATAIWYSYQNTYYKIQNTKYISHTYYTTTNNSLFSKAFPNSLKKASMTHVFKKD